MENWIKKAEVALNSVVHSKPIKLLYLLDDQIKKNFKIEAVITRPVNSNGLWCFTLIPAIFLTYNHFYEVSPLYELLATLCMGLLAYSVLFILFLYTSCLVLKGSYTSGCTFAIFVSTVPIYCCLRYDLMFSLFISATAIVSYSYVLKNALMKCPQTFTIGEAMIVSQGVCLTFTTAVIFVLSGKYLPDLVDNDKEIILIKTYIFTILSTVGLLVKGLWWLDEYHRSLRNFCWLVILAAVFAFGSLCMSLGTYFLWDFCQYLFRDTLRLKLLMFWLWLLILATLIVMYRSEIGIKVTSATRKTFHLLASLVFLTGVLYDTPLVILASGIIFGVLIFVEAIRLSGIEPMSSWLQTAFNVYADEKDVGVFAMTPLYLYVGLACPLVLVPGGAGSGAALERLSGVLCVGVGDTAASCCGERYGTNKWPGSNRTLEGTIANIGSQIITVYILNLFKLLDCPNSLFRAAVAAGVSGLAESRLEQVDNLVLPLVTILAFQLTAFLNYC